MRLAVSKQLQTTGVLLAVVVFGVCSLATSASAVQRIYTFPLSGVEKPRQVMFDAGRFETGHQTRHLLRNPKLIVSDSDEQVAWTLRIVEVNVKGTVTPIVGVGAAGQAGELRPVAGSDFELLPNGNLRVVDHERGIFEVNRRTGDARLLIPCNQLHEGNEDGAVLFSSGNLKDPRSSGRPDGSFYFSDGLGERVFLAIPSNGIYEIQTAIGGGPHEPTTEPRHATEVRIGSENGFRTAVTPDGRLLVLDTFQGALIEVGRDRNAKVIKSFPDDFRPEKLVVLRDGSILIGDHHRGKIVRLSGPDLDEEVIMGENPSPGSLGRRNGIPLSDARMKVSYMSEAHDGGLFIQDRYTESIRYVEPFGISDERRAELFAHDFRKVFERLPHTLRNTGRLLKYPRKVIDPPTMPQLPKEIIQKIASHTMDDLPEVWWQAMVARAMDSGRPSAH